MRTSMNYLSFVIYSSVYTNILFTEISEKKKIKKQ